MSSSRCSRNHANSRPGMASHTIRISSIGPNHIQHSIPLFLSEAKGRTKLRSGRILTPATVTRVADANVVHLEQEIPLNGAYRIYLFAGKPTVTRNAVADFAFNLSKKSSFYSAYSRPDIDSVDYHERHTPHSNFFSLATIFNAKPARH